MKLLATIQGDIAAVIRKEQSALADALRLGVHRAGQTLQENLRGQVRRVGLGQGLEKAWRLEKYPKRRSRSSLDPVALVYSKSTVLHRAFDEARSITPRQSGWLVIALPAAINLGLGYSTRSRKGGPVPAGQRRKVSDIEAAARLLKAEVVSAMPGRRVKLRASKARSVGGKKIAGRRIVIIKSKKGVGLTAVFYENDRAKPLPLFALRRSMTNRKLLDIEGPAKAAARMVVQEVRLAMASAGVGPSA